MVGLIQPLIWNKTTGNLVSGHQRISIIDELEKTDEYELSVAVVILTEEQEKEQNVFLNSTTFTGTFDFTALKNLIDDGMDYDAAGLDLYDLNIIGVEAVPETRTDEGDPESNEARKQEAKKQAVKAARKKGQDAIENRFDEGGSYVSLSFDDYEAKSEWMERWGFGADDLFIKGEVFQKIVQQRIEDNEK